MSLDRDNLARVARRTAARPEFMAWVLARYAQIERADASTVAAALGASEEAFLRLHLCLRPRAEHFADDVRDIARHVDIDPHALAAVVRKVDVVDAMTNAPVATTQGTLLAARSRKPTKKDPSPDDGKGAP